MSNAMLAPVKAALKSYILNKYLYFHSMRVTEKYRTKFCGWFDSWASRHTELQAKGWFIMDIEYVVKIKPFFLTPALKINDFQDIVLLETTFMTVNRRSQLQACSASLPFIVFVS